MFSLVFWENNTYSIVKSSKIRYKNDGTQEAKWRGKLYSARVIQESDQKSWLETLSVTTDGEIIMEADLNLDNLAKKRELANTERKINKDKKSELISIDNEVLCQRSVFQESISDNNLNDVIINSSSSSPIRLQSINYDKTIECPLCTSTLKVSDESLLFMKSIVNFIEKKDKMTDNIITMQEPLNEHENFTIPTVKFEERMNSSSTMTELVQNSSVYISNEDLFLIKKLKRDDPKEMTRRLMKSIIGEESLLKMTLSGKSKDGKMVAVPKKILVAVEEFIEKNTSKRCRISHSEFNTCVTQLLNTLRHSKPSRRTKEECQSTRNTCEEMERELDQIRTPSPLLRSIGRENSTIDLSISPMETQHDVVKQHSCCIDDQGEEIKGKSSDKENTTNIEKINKKEREIKEKKREKERDKYSSRNLEKENDGKYSHERSRSREQRRKRRSHSKDRVERNREKDKNQKRWKRY